MDALALLCNLHAEGPATLSHIRRVGVESMSSLLEMEPSALARKLGWEPARSERFLRAARALGDRTGEPLLASDEAIQAEDQTPAPPLEVGVGSSTSFPPVQRAASPSGPAPFGATADGDLLMPFERDEVQRAHQAPKRSPAVRDPRASVLGQWRRLDRESPPVAPAQKVLREPVAGSTTPWERVQLDGLTDTLRRALQGRGIHDLETFVATPCLELSEGLGVGYTRLERLQFLARRALSDTPAEAHPGPVSERRLDSAGPFA